MDIGIDLGTTFSVLAVNGRIELAADYPPGRYLEEFDVTIIPTPYGEETFASVMIDDPDDPARALFAADALQKAEDGHAPVMFSKRKIGTREAIPLPTRAVLARDVAREFLRHLKACAERALGRPVTRAVVTHPAYFDRGQVEETRAAAGEAGFDMGLPEQMLMEPVAAALTYTRADPRDPLRVLTYDLGGGTFDVTYLERSRGVISLRAFDGDPLLGGYNFDRALVHWLRQRLEARGQRVAFNEEDHADRGRLARLLRVAEQVKIALAKAPSDTAPVDFRVRGVLADAKGRDVAVNERITRAEFVALIRPLLDRTVEGCRRALTKGKVEAKDIDEVLLVGGSTYGPWVADCVKAAFPGLAPRLFQPDLCVGAGAAIHARLALPPLVAAGQYKLVLMVPEKTVLPTLTVSGQITGSSGKPSAEPLHVSLRLPTGEVQGPEPVAADGGFLFEDVALSPDESNSFTLSVSRAGGAAVLEHVFRVEYVSEATEASSVTTVLPKSLFIETLDGLVPLAEEGAPLPARCEQTFRRLNNNPSMPIKLFQGRDPIGEVRIDNIPPEGGQGSFVDLRVEVTEKNQVRGTAQVRTAKGQVVARADVHIHFDTPEVPPAGMLYDQFQELQVRCLMLLRSDDERREQLQAEALPLIQEVTRLFEQQPLERGEVYVALRQLSNLLAPPKDAMQPSRAEFTRLLERCRDGVKSMAEKAQADAEAARGPAGGTADASALKAAQQKLQKAQHFRQVIDRLEQDGLAAHERRDRKTWATVCDALEHIELQTRERPKMETPPTIMSKLIAGLEVMRELGRLQHKARKLEMDGRLDDWLQELERIGGGLAGLRDRIQVIDDDLPGDQGRAQIAVLFTRELQPLQEAIIRLGMDISKVKS